MLACRSQTQAPVVDSCFRTVHRTGSAATASSSAPLRVDPVSVCVAAITVEVSAQALRAPRVESHGITVNDTTRSALVSVAPTGYGQQGSGFGPSPAEKHRKASMATPPSGT